MTDLKRRSFIAALSATPFALPLLSKAESLLSYSPNDNDKQDNPSNAHFTSTTDLNTSNATAIISLRGLGIDCFGPNGYESGFVPHSAHKYMLEIKQIGPGATTLLRPRELVTQNIRIEVDNPMRPGVFAYQNGQFSRPNGSTDERHFGWVLDIEGERMHETQLSLIQLSTPGTPRMLRVFIPHATLYTKTLGTTVYARVNSHNMKEPSVLIGRVAQEIGAAIECRPEAGSGIRIVFLEGQQPISLPRVEGLKYEVNLYNLRPDHTTHTGSDFPFYYRVLRDPGGRQFNLAHVQAKSHELPKKQKHREIPPNLYRRGCCGLACDKVRLGRSTSLEQPTPS